jgi:homoserine dehydrogenase
VTLTRVLVQDSHRPRDVALAPGVLTTDLAAFLATDADVVVEALGGIEPARAIVEESLRRGRTVITANKALLAAHGASLAALAGRCGGTLRYDAAVGGGVPILRLIDDALGARVPVCVRGILNGTTNFVLSALEAGDSLEDALERARALGFAEVDASRDLHGQDAADKLRLVAWAAYNIAPDRLQVRQRSLLPAPGRYVALAARLGRRVRQLAECAVVGDAVVACVEPVLVAWDGALARIRAEQNHVEVSTGGSAPLTASGPGAGGVPTATALLSDLVSTARSARRPPATIRAEIDARQLAWAIEIRGGAALLHALPGCGVVRTTRMADISWTIIPSATPTEIDGLLRLLVTSGADPIAVRLDDVTDHAHLLAGLDR